MDWITEPERKIPVVENVDVLVCGGGFAGVAAAVSAAKNGASVLLLEKYGFLGGLVTTSLVITTPPLDNGINREIRRRLKEKSVYARCPNSGEEDELHAIDPEVVKYELVSLLKETGVDFILHTLIVGSILDGNVIKGVTIESKAGRQAILGKMVVDATGDADIAAFAGAPFRLVKKPMTMMFNMVGVDIERALGQLGGNWGNIRKLVQEGIDKKELFFDLGIFRNFGAPGVNAEKLVYGDEVNLWSGNLLDLDGTRPRDLTRAEVTTREHVFKLAEFLKRRLAGFEKARIEYTATQVGVRATRQILGESMPSMEQVKKEKFADTVAKPYLQQEMRLPYGSILPQKIDNLLVAGRCISASEEAMGKLRLIPVCSATGEAAGTAAALSWGQKVPPRDLNRSLLRETLQKQGVDLGLE
jgi:ribulose 1,5-bisphosphate synthetase/thiazole synthase